MQAYAGKYSEYGKTFYHANATTSKSDSDAQFVYEIPHYNDLVDILDLPENAVCSRCLHPVSVGYPDCKDLLFRAGDRVSVNGVSGTVADDGNGNAMTESGSVWIVWDKAQTIGKRIYHADGEWVDAEEISKF